MRIFIILLVTVASAFSAWGSVPRVIDIDSSFMKVFLPPGDLSTGRAIVCCPGGGYSDVAIGHEGYDWAPFFNNLGLTFVVLQYHLPAGDLTKPLGDVEKAFKVLTDSAAVWGIDPEQIGVMGSSAGGHLASVVATHPTAACCPSFQLLFYPVVSLDKCITHAGTRNEFLGSCDSDELAAEYSAENKVKADTPRAFIVHCGDDDVVHPQNSIRYYSALQRHGVPATLVMFPDGRHGWGYRGWFPHHDELLGLIVAWLKSF